MNPLIRQGQRQTTGIFVSLLLMEIYIIIFYQLYMPGDGGKKLFQQIVRFGMTGFLIYFILQGKNWARITMGILLILAVFLGLISLLLPVPIVYKIPLMVMIIIYCIGIYHFFFSKAFKAYFNYLSLPN
ncbi:MAG: hypothetical protein ACO1N0_03925 [Fluviicola sp.]